MTHWILSKGPAARLLVVLTACLLVASCRLTLRVSSNGTITSESGTYDCGPNAECTIRVNDIFFDETFIGSPDDGYMFTGWLKAGRHFCGNQTDPCRLFTSEFEGVPELEAFFSGNRQFFLSPTFARFEDVLAGTWEGQWNNLTFGSVGAITFTLEPRPNGSWDVTSDIDGNVFGGPDPAPVSDNVRPDTRGGLSITQTAVISGVTIEVEFRIAPDGTITADIPNLTSLPGFSSFESTGTVNSRRIRMEYTINFTSGSPATGTIELDKQ